MLSRPRYINPDDYAPCPSPECGCPGCAARCVGCRAPLGEWANTPGVEISQRPYCDDCAPVATDALASAVLLLLRAPGGGNVWDCNGRDVTRPRMNAALHLTRPAHRSGAVRLFPSSVPEVLR